MSEVLHEDMSRKVWMRVMMVMARIRVTARMRVTSRAWEWKGLLRWMGDGDQGTGEITLVCRSLEALRPICQIQWVDSYRIYEDLIALTEYYN